jgi:hypothetical protein
VFFCIYSSIPYNYPLIKQKMGQTASYAAGDDGDLSLVFTGEIEFLRSKVFYFSVEMRGKNQHLLSEGRSSINGSCFFIWCVWGTILKAFPGKAVGTSEIS